MIGLNIAFFAVGYNPCLEHIIAAQSQDEFTQNQESSSSEESTPEFFLMAYNAIVPAIQLHVDHDLYFIFDIPLVEENEYQIFSDTVSFVNSYFQTLFRQIISPNAP